MKGRGKAICVVVCAVALLYPPISHGSQNSPKLILGWLEPIEFMASGMRIKSKLDVGAKTSSMQATNLEYFDKSGKPWVRFDFTDENLRNEQQQTLRLAGPLVREVLIKRHGAPSVSRPVINFTFCLHNQIYTAEFSLTDRSEFNYAILLGRSFLSQVALIDSSQTFLSAPACRDGDAIKHIAN